MECAFHQITRDYDYMISVERIWDKWDSIEAKARDEVMGPYGHCMHGMEFPSRKYLAHYNVNNALLQMPE